MLRVDGGYLYETAKSLDRIANLKDEDTTKISLYFDLGPARDTIEQIVYKSIFSSGFHVVHNSSRKLLEAIDKNLPDLSDPSTFEESISGWVITHIKNQFRHFEAILQAELQSRHVFCYA